ncbi:MAG: aminoglycoside phosphotransferase family protein [Clostridiales bacterium]|nr:aminoglycoside phosphotransferase family protein [Clostridiales bacterium]
MIYNRIKNVLNKFCFRGEYMDVQELSSGNVNQTYHLFYNDCGKSCQYVLQRINGYVFKEPENVMRNIVQVTEHLRTSMEMQGLCADGHVLDIIKTVEGKPYYVDQYGGFWRAYVYIENAIAPDMVTSLDMMREVGRGFGNFQRLLVDFPAKDLYVPIPNFHNTTKRFYTFVRAVDEDKAGRVKKVEDEIEFFFEHRRMMNQIVQLLDNGTLPLRVTHNDTKSNNVMMDITSGKAVCVIDLDTVMPGSSLYDYGDAVRFGASTAAEDEPDTTRIALDMDKTRAFTEGFVEETNGFLTQAELRRLPLGIKVITCELAMRFLTDYIDGDLYFRVKSPQHNLIRARAQMALLRDIEKKQDQLEDMMDDLLRRKF